MNTFDKLSTGGLFTMSVKEINRLSIMKQLIKKEIKQKKAAKILSLSVRQVKRLKKRYQQEGAAGLIHQGRGKPSNRCIPKTEINRAIDIVRSKYWDFGPTLAWEKLQKFHQVSFSREKLRQAMITANIWQAKKQRKLKVYQLRQRRASEGELVQIDSSPHAWFENRGPKCDLLGYIDDATSKVKWLEFAPSETTAAYFKATKGYLLKHGKPLAFYADKHSVFRINPKKNGDGSTGNSQGLTQFGRAMKQLGIDLIPAHSAQAKGRIEKLFNTLQDRLVKELRLKEISDIKKANQYLPTFIKEFNQKFAVAPKNAKNTHLPLLALDKKNLSKTLARQETRTLSKSLTCQFENKLYQIKTDRPTYTMRHAPVLIVKNPAGKVSIEYKGKKLSYQIIKTQPRQKAIDAKELNHVIDQIKKKKAAWKPAADHPWRQQPQLWKQQYVYANTN